MSRPRGCARPPRVDADPASTGARAPLKIFAAFDALAVVAAQPQVSSMLRLLANGTSDASSD